MNPILNDAPNPITNEEEAPIVDEEKVPTMEGIEAPIVDDTCWFAKGVLGAVVVTGVDVVVVEVELDMVAMGREKGSLDLGLIMTKGNEFGIS